MAIRLYNTATRTKEDFVPIDPSNVRMYVCGPTVYDRAHIGNARPVVVFDVLYRLLRHEYGAEHVKYARNFTDVDDKINAKAAETGRSIRDITDETIRWYHEDMDALGALRPDHEPRATEYIAQMIAMIEGLIDTEHAYAKDGHVLFEVGKDPQYGSLSRRSLDEMRAGARVEVAPYKKSPMDFVLWKPSTPDLPSWNSPWGPGRPGWHIECSAMAKELFGERFDIHGGGIDLAFPHHENECAQSRCAGYDFANTWMHNGYLMVEGEKMSKSLGNFFTVDEITKGSSSHNRSFPPRNGEVVRLAMMMTHYRSPIDWTDRALSVAEKTLRKWWKLIDPGPTVQKSYLQNEVRRDVIDALSDDLNTPKAISILHKAASEGNESGLRVGADLLGLLDTRRGNWTISPSAHGIDELKIQRLVEMRDMAKFNKDFKKADELRDLLSAAGVDLKDGKHGSIWELCSHFDASKLPEIEDV